MAFLSFVCLLIGFFIYETASLHLYSRYSAKGILTVYSNDTQGIPSSSTMIIYRDSIQDKSLLKYELGSWAKEYGWEYHVDVIEKSSKISNQYIDYFWYLTYDNTPEKCTYSVWNGSTNRTPFYSLSILDDATNGGPMSMRGATSNCWYKSVDGYGPVTQCYIQDQDNENLIPWVFEGNGQCCVGANRWDFADYQNVTSFDNAFFDVPSNCTPATAMVVNI